MESEGGRDREKSAIFNGVSPFLRSKEFPKKFVQSCEEQMQVLYPEHGIQAQEQLSWGR